jgi:hypothetical protein
MERRPQHLNASCIDQYVEALLFDYRGYDIVYCICIPKISFINETSTAQGFYFRPYSSLGFYSLDKVSYERSVCNKCLYTRTRIISTPASARPRAMAWPMPHAPPVTKAVLPSRRKRSSMLEKQAAVYPDSKFSQNMHALFSHLSCQGSIAIIYQILTIGY